MLNFNENVTFHVGDLVECSGFEDRGSIESIRIISDASLVEEYNGKPSEVVVTVKMNDAIINKRGMEVTPVENSAYF